MERHHRQRNSAERNYLVIDDWLESGAPIYFALPFPK